jgi:hypothetical protein
VKTRLLPVGVLGAIAIAIAAIFGALGYAAPNQTAAQAQYAPTNTTAPAVSDTTPSQGQTLTANPGTWSGDQPIVFTFQWLRCNPGGQNCVNIPGATDQRYTVQSDDVGNSLRVRVTGTNASGTSSANSAATARVTPPGAPPAFVDVADVNPPERLIAAQVQFNPSPIRSRTAPITVRVRVMDTRGIAVRGAVVFVRSTPLVTRTPGEVATGEDGFAQVVLTPRDNIRLVFRRGYNLQIFVRVRKPGDDPLAGVSSRRLVQVRISPGS